MKKHNLTKDEKKQAKKVRDNRKKTRNIKRDAAVWLQSA